jgi:hypothetical protein
LPFGVLHAPRSTNDAPEQAQAAHQAPTRWFDSWHLMHRGTMHALEEVKMWLKTFVTKLSWHTQVGFPLSFLCRIADFGAFGSVPIINHNTHMHYNFVFWINYIASQRSHWETFGRHEHPLRRRLLLSYSFLCSDNFTQNMDPSSGKNI